MYYYPCTRKKGIFNGCLHNKQDYNTPKYSLYNKCLIKNLLDFEVRDIYHKWHTALCMRLKDNNDYSIDIFYIWCIFEFNEFTIFITLPPWMFVT